MNPARLWRWMNTYPGRLSAVIAAAMLARLVSLGSLPLWGDEAFTAVVASHRLPALLDIVRHDSGPPLSYLIAHVVEGLTTAPVALRAVSVAAGVVAVLASAALGRRIGGDAAGIFAAAFAGALPWMIQQSRDARMYALATALVVVAALLLLRVLEDPGLWRWAAYAAVVGLAAYTHYLAALAILIQLVCAAAILHPSPRRAVAAASAAATGLLSLLPWLLVSTSQFAHLDQSFWVAPLDLRQTAETMAAFVAGPVADSGAAHNGVLAVGHVVVLALGWTLVLSSALAWRRWPPPERRVAAFLAAAALGGVIAVVLLSLRQPLFYWRYTVVAASTLPPMVGAAVAQHARWRPAAAGALVVVATYGSLLAVWQTNPAVPAIAAVLDSDLRGGDQLAMSGTSRYFALVYYSKPGTGGRVHVVGAVPWYDGVAALPPGTVVPSLTAGAGAGAIFVVRDPAQRGPAVPAGYRRTGGLCAPGVCLDRYSRVGG